MLSEHEYMAFVPCPSCTEVIPVVCGYQYAAENYCGCCWASFKLMDGSGKYQPPDEEIQPGSDEPEEPWPY